MNSLMAKHSLLSKNFGPFDSRMTMTVKKETAQIRPFVVCAILRNVPWALEKVLLRLMLVGTPVVLQKKHGEIPFRFGTGS